MMEQEFLAFKTVADTRNITLAAKKLHMSQSSISLQIQNLESYFGARFFDRTNKGVTLTRSGKVFYNNVCQILDILHDVRDTLSELIEDRREVVCLGATLTIGEYVLPRILAYLYTIHPEIDFKVKIANTEVISQDVLEKKIHIGLIEGPIARHKELMIEQFWQDELVVVVPYYHPWAERASISLDELPGERMIAREVGSGTRKVLELALQERGFDPDKLDVTMELGSTQAIKEVVSAGLGMTIISSLTVRRECDQRIFKTLQIQGSPIYRPLNILTLANTSATREERFLINLLRDRARLSEVLNSDYCNLEERLNVEGRKTS